MDIILALLEEFGIEGLGIGLFLYFLLNGEITYRYPRGHGREKMR